MARPVQGFLGSFLQAADAGKIDAKLAWHHAKARVGYPFHIPCTGFEKLIPRVARDHAVQWIEQRQHRGRDGRFFNVLCHAHGALHVLGGGGLSRNEPPEPR